MNFSHEKCIAKCNLLWASRLAGHMAKTFGMKQSFYNHQIIVKHLTSVLIFVSTHTLYIVVGEKISEMGDSVSGEGTSFLRPHIHST